MPHPPHYRIGPFVLDLAAFRLERGGAGVPLTPKAFELLALLIRERQRALTKQEILDTVWADTAVTENTLTQRIKEIREALGDSAHDSTYIRTIPRVGFQWVAEVVEAEPAAASPILGRDVESRGFETPAAVAAPPDAPSGSAEQPIASRTDRRVALTIAGLGALAVATWLLYGPRPADPVAESGATSRRVMLAILPFQDLSGDPEQGYLGDGLTEELIAELGRLDPAGLGVIARTSAMAYKDTTKSVAQIAAELGVDFIFEGSVRREGERVRIVAQLVRASDQTHVWAERYDRDVRSILSLQAEVARAIAVGTRLSLSAAMPPPLGPSVTVRPDAYHAYLRGRFFLHQRTGAAIEKALQQFQQAIATDPGYARAHAGLADAYELAASYANSLPRESFERGMEAARRALELDPELAEAHTSLGTMYTSYLWDWAQAENAYLRALALNPSGAAAHKGYGELLSFQGRHDEAIAALARAVELDPVSLLMHANLGIVYWRARRYDEAMQQMQQTLSMDPNYMLAHLNVGLIHAARGSYDEAARAFSRAREYAPQFGDALGLLGYAYGRRGRVEDARRVGSELGRLSSEGHVSGYIRALYHLGLGEREEALTELERAYDERSWQVAMLKVDPLLDELRSAPRFQTLLLRTKLTE